MRTAGARSEEPVLASCPSIQEAFRFQPIAISKTKSFPAAQTGQLEIE